MKPGHLVELLVTQQRNLAEAQERIRTLEATVDELQKQLAASATVRCAEPISLKAEEKRQEARGRKAKKKKHKPRRRGRLSTAEKLALAEHEQSVLPEGVDRRQCQFSHSRPVWCLIDGRAVLVAYHVYRGPRNKYGKIPGTLGRSEFGLEIIVAIANLVFLVGLSFDKVCLVMNFFQHLPLKRSQVDALLHQLARHWEREFDRLCTLLAHSAVVHADETSWSINSVWPFLSEKARRFFFGVHKDSQTLEQILDAATFAGIQRTARPIHRLASPLGFVRAFPLPPFRCGRRKSRIFSQDQAIPTMARPALNVPQPSLRQEMIAPASAVRARSFAGMRQVYGGGAVGVDSSSHTVRYAPSDSKYSISRR